MEPLNGNNVKIVDGDDNIMTKIEQLMSNYFDFYNESLNRNHVYRNHLNKFVNYLKLEESDLLDNFLLIDNKVIKRCVIYYYNKGRIKSLATTMSFMDSLKGFYKFLYEKEGIPDIFYGDNYKKIKEEIISECNLKKSSERGFYKEEEIEKILLKLDEAINDFENDMAGIREEDRHLQRIILRLFIKLTLIAPAKRNVITSIKRSDITEEYNKLLINDIEINIPYGLSRDLSEALKYAKSRNKESIKDKDYLFEYLYRYKGKFIDAFLNTWFYNVAKDFKVLKNERRDKKTLAVEPIRNMSIQTMIKNKVNPIAISGITGIDLDALKKMYREEQIDSGEEINKINSKFRKWL